MPFSELENDTLNQSELNETNNFCQQIKINENNQIFEVLDKMKIRGGESLSGLKNVSVEKYTIL